jgi:hypothetical protein
MLADELDYVIGVDTNRDEHVLAVLTATAGAVVAGEALPAMAKNTPSRNPDVDGRAHDVSLPHRTLWRTRVLAESNRHLRPAAQASLPEHWRRRQCLRLAPARQSCP